MSSKKHIKALEKHLQASRDKLLEKAASYKYIDESTSDMAAYKAMKIRTKINQIHYLEGVSL